MSKPNFSTPNTSPSNTSPSNTVTIRHNPDLKLKITDEAFCKFKFMRDHSPNEVAMFGITKPDDPLFVYDFALVKQKVNPVSADVDADGLCDHIAKYYSLGVGPLNCERVWCHTHPMQGAGSANPSAKDMATWNHADNSKKNFFVMMILSKSGEITCRLRIRGNANTLVSGLNYNIDIDETISVSIVQTDSFSRRIDNAAAKFFTEDGLRALDKDAISKFVMTNSSLKDIFPEFNELIAEYDKLVSIDTPSIVSFGNTTNHITYGTYNNSQKKISSPKDVPDMAVIAGDDLCTLKNVTMGSRELISISNKYSDRNGKTLIKIDLEELEDEFNKDYASQDSDICMAILGAMRGKTVSSSGTKFRVDLYPTNKESRGATAVGAGMFWPTYLKLAKTINGFVDQQ